MSSLRLLLLIDYLPSPLSGCGQSPPWPAGWDVRPWPLPSALARRVASALRMFALIPQRKRRSGTTQNIPDLRVAKAGWAFRSFLCWYSRCQPCSGESPCNAIASRAPGEGFLRAKPISYRQPAKTPIRARLYKAPLAAGKQRCLAPALRSFTKRNSFVSRPPFSDKRVPPPALCPLFLLSSVCLKIS